MQPALLAIPAKRYFTIGEVSELCGVKPHVLRFWEQEFAQLRPMKRRGNRRYYQHHEVLLVRRIRELLYEQGFTINGARGQLSEAALKAVPQTPQPSAFEADEATAEAPLAPGSGEPGGQLGTAVPAEDPAPPLIVDASGLVSVALLRDELTLIRDLLTL